MKRNNIHHLLFNFNSLLQEEEFLLKKPFRMNCKDYEELWEKNNHTGLRTREVIF